VQFRAVVGDIDDGLVPVPAGDDLHLRCAAVARTRQEILDGDNDAVVGHRREFRRDVHLDTWSRRLAVSGGGLPEDRRQVGYSPVDVARPDDIRGRRDAVTHLRQLLGEFLEALDRRSARVVAACHFGGVVDGREPVGQCLLEVALEDVVCPAPAISVGDVGVDGEPVGTSVLGVRDTTVPEPTDAVGRLSGDDRLVELPALRPLVELHGLVPTRLGDDELVERRPDDVGAVVPEDLVEGRVDRPDDRRPVDEFDDRDGVLGQLEQPPEPVVGAHPVTPVPTVPDTLAPTGRAARS
jgi:hypothetical protein